MTKHRALVWLIPILLLTTVLASIHLDSDGLWFDELWSYIIAGGAEYGPLTLPQVWDKVASTDPIQGVGYPIVLAAWGGLAGWSEYSARVLALFMGLVTVALVYRIGREMVSDEAGICAALFLSVTALFLHYLHEARTFSLLMLAGALLVWAYWRSITARRWQWRYALAMTAGATGLLYSHYYGGMLLIGLAVTHGLVAPKNRAWLRPIIPALLTGVLFLPSLSMFLDGYQRYAASGIGVAEDTMLTTGALLQKLIFYVGNGSPMLAGIVLILGVIAAIKGTPGARMLLVMTLLTAGILLLMNIVFQMMDASRLRYALPLWLTLAALAGAGIAYTRRWHRYLPALLALLWLIQGFITAADPAFLREIEVGNRLRWRTLTEVMQREGLPEDLFVFYIGDFTWDATFVFDHAVHDLGFPAVTTLSLTSDENRDQALDRIASARRLWYGVDLSKPVTPVYAMMQTLLDEQFVLCGEMVARDGMKLTLYARTGVFCPTSPPDMEFGRGIVLRADWQDELTQLRVNIGVTIPPDIPPDIYSVAVHLTDSADHLLGQADAPLPNRAFATIALEMPLGEHLPPGEYFVYLLVYNWRIGDRLSAHFLDNDLLTDRLALTTITR